MTRHSWIAYGGDMRRRDAALAQMRQHLEDARFDDIQVGGRSVFLYGWSRPREDAAAAVALGLPESLLRLACWLYEGFPEDEASVRAQIASYMEMLEAFPVGADLSCAAGLSWEVPDALYQAAYKSIYGANGVDVRKPWTRLRFIRETFLDALA